MPNLIGTQVSFIVRDSNSHVIPGFQDEPPVISISVMDSYTCLEDAIDEPYQIVSGLIQTQDLEDTDTGLSGTGNLLVLVPNYLTETNDVYYVELGATLEFGVYQKEEL